MPIAARVGHEAPSAEGSIPQEFNQIFTDCQASAATHRKNIVALDALRTKAINELGDERAVEEVKRLWLTAVDRILVTRKSAGASERVMKFILAVLTDIKKEGLKTFEGLPDQLLTETSR